LSVVVVFYKIRKILMRLSKKKVLIVVIFFVTTLFFNASLFYYVESVIGGRADVDFYLSMYWALITMSTIGYGDITPRTELGYAVASVAAVMGIVVYTLTISVIADAFLSNMLKNLMGLGKMKKQILVIGDSGSCAEVVDELVKNRLETVTGWVKGEMPKNPLPVDYVVGDYSEDTLKRAGVEHAKHVILCLEDDDKALHLSLLVRKLNKKARITAIVSSEETRELLHELRVDYILSSRMLGRLAASSVFEPLVVNFLTEVSTARGYADLVEHVVSDREEGITVEELELMLGGKTKEKYKALLLVRGEHSVFLPGPDTMLKRGDRLVLLKALH